MGDEELCQIAVGAFQMFQNVVPIDTGNMRYNATQFESRGGNEYAIVVNGNVAPYTVYTNEPWRWRRNPNEHWIDDAVDLIAEIIASGLGGEIRRK